VEAENPRTFNTGKFTNTVITVQENLFIKSGGFLVSVKFCSDNYGLRFFSFFPGEKEPCLLFIELFSLRCFLKATCNRETTNDMYFKGSDQ
jgi:hypothetical protein